MTNQGFSTVIFVMDYDCLARLPPSIPLAPLFESRFGAKGEIPRYARNDTMAT